MKKFIIYLLFLIIILGDLTGELFQIKVLDYIFKPFIMIWIGGFFALHAQSINRKIVQLAVLAFVFSWFGDMFLMFGDNKFIFFILGLASFLLAQIVYIFLYLRTINLSGKKPFLKSKPYYLLGYIVYGLVIYTILFNHLDAVLKIAVFVYMLALLSMSAMALNRFGNSQAQSFKYIFIGSLLFVISDTLIATNKFLSPIPYEGIFVMTTYISAQYLIMRGLLKQYA